MPVLTWEQELKIFGYYGTPEGLACLSALCAPSADRPSSAVIQNYHRLVELCCAVRCGTCEKSEAVREAQRIRRAPDRLPKERTQTVLDSWRRC